VTRQTWRRKEIIAWDTRTAWRLTWGLMVPAGTAPGGKEHIMDGWKGHKKNLPLFSSWYLGGREHSISARESDFSGLAFWDLRFGNGPVYLGNDMNANDRWD
jgi:hypothetical protein